MKILDMYRKSDRHAIYSQIRTNIPHIIIDYAFDNLLKQPMNSARQNISRFMYDMKLLIGRKITN